jgi:16S rRNA pseudouridine516 synthase
MKLDRVIAKHRSLGRSAAHVAIASGRVLLNGGVCRDQQVEVSKFCSIMLGDEIVQEGGRALYLMLHKPAGWLCSTEDARHPTVIDLIDDPDRHTLHLAGRLDRSTTGLVLLTNDGRWSKRLMHPDHKVPKVYLVDTEEVIPASAVEAFAQGFYFPSEDVTTLPAELILLGPTQARVTLHEGRHHQVKRMFHRVGCRVTALHRESVGSYVLPPQLLPGQWQPVDPDHQTSSGQPG